MKSRQNLIADPFVEWHSAGAGRSLIDHARTEYRIGFVGEQRREKGGQFFRCVLAVAVHQRDDIKVVIDRVAITELLVTTVALVLRRAQDRDLEVGVLLLKAQAVSKRIVF